MFFVVRKSRIIPALLLVFTLLSAIYFASASKDKNQSICTDFLKNLGYTFDKKPEEISEIKIPEGFGNVYTEYNRLQEAAGFDLTPLRGKTVTRYTFRLKGCEFPLANILVSDGKICGGDIMDPSLSGKMIPLLPK